MLWLSITVSDLACERGGEPVFAGVGFTLHGGEALVLRGPNGSGKSSLLRVLGGLMRPAAGSVVLTLDGRALASEERARAAHLVGHLPALTDALSVAANLRFQATLLGGKPSDLAPALERVGLAAAAREPARKLSAGQRRRLALARLIAVPRPLWLLDEPTEALDAEGEAMALSLMREHQGAGGALVVATHGALALPARVLTLVPGPRTLAEAA